MLKNTSGWLNINKTVGKSSTFVSSKARRLLGASKAGHLGTLDPLACGVLPIALGEATKTIPYALYGEKEYRFQIRWGVQTDTLDVEGKPVDWSDKRPSAQDISNALIHFRGDIVQVPPIFSAIKVNGKRAYELARNNCEVDLKPRRVRIDELELESIDDQDHATFRVVCGAGTYIRSLAQDISVFMGTLGHVSFLQRTRVGKFSINDSICLEKIEELVHNEQVFLGLLPIGVVLDDIPAISVNEEQRSKLLNGASIKLSHGAENLLTLWHQGVLVAIGQMEDGLIKPKRVFVY